MSDSSVSLGIADYAPNSLSHTTHHGSGRDLSAKDLQKYDVIVTIYQPIVGKNSSITDESTNRRRQKKMADSFNRDQQSLAA